MKMPYTYPMIKREISQELAFLAKNYPVVTVLGPRQAGKTTLVKEVFPHLPYVNLETPDVRAAVEFDPKSLFSRYPDGMVLDEIQRLPQLLSYLQVFVDEHPEKKGKFILTGSHQLALHEAITQSLAGRTALLTLLPLNFLELRPLTTTFTPDDYLLNGFYPRIYHDNLDPVKAYRNYFQTYVERDVRQLIHLKDLSQFQKFMKLCAGRIGQILNIQSLSNDLGVSNHTIKHWLSILEASFVIFQLQPYFENFGKRLIKSPKLYFVDPGLACYLLDIETIEQLQRDPLRGNLFENMVILELMKARLNQGKDPHLYYYRDNNQREIDVIYKSGNELVPIEIKSSETFHPAFMKSLEFLEKLVPERVSRGYVIYGGEDSYSFSRFSVLNYLKAVEGIK